MTWADAIAGARQWASAGGPADPALVAFLYVLRAQTALVLARMGKAGA